MKILALEHEIPGATSEDFQGVADDEARRVWELTQEEKIREISFRRDQDRAVILLECLDPEEAEKILATLPMVNNGLIEFELIPLKPYPGLARLFDSVEETGIDRDPD